MYHYITVQFVLRDCESNGDAVVKLETMLPYKPDENTTHMESWEIQKVVEAKNVSHLQRL
jgi:hypothetical protein